MARKFIEKEPCWWCKPGPNSGPATLELVIGSGAFRDFDSDTSYGIPVCGGCGGLGYQYPGNDFEEKTKEIMKLRFEYCPTDGRTLPPEVKLAKLQGLRAKISELYRKYQAQQPEEDCFAKRVSEGGLDEKIDRIKREELARYN